MMKENNPSPPNWPAAIHTIFKQQGITFVSYVPDAGHTALIKHCQADPEITTIPLTTEEEGIPLAAGAYLGGKRAASLMQSSGVGNCVNMFSLATLGRFPLFLLVTMRGEWGEFNPWQVPMGQRTEAVLNASRVITYRVSYPDEVPQVVEAAAQLAFASYQAVAVLLSQQLVGSKTFKR